MTKDVENEPILYGFDTSTYTQIVLLILLAKGVAHRYDRVANWTGDTKLRDYRELNPFGLIPVFEHGGMRLYETLSIAEYIDEVFPGPSLKPISPTDRARMWQLIAIHDHHVRRPWVTMVSGERDFAPLAGQVADEEAIKAALPAAELAADVLDDLLGSRSNTEPDLADYWLVPATRFFMNTPEGAAIIEKRPALLEWWKRMVKRTSFAETYRTVAPDSS